MTADETARLRALRDALSRCEVSGEVMRVKGGMVSVKLVMSVATWPLLAWAVSDSTEEVDMDPLERTGVRHPWPAK